MHPKYIQSQVPHPHQFNCPSSVLQYQEQMLVLYFLLIASSVTLIQRLQAADGEVT